MCVKLIFKSAFCLTNCNRNHSFRYRWNSF